MDQDELVEERIAFEIVIVARAQVHFFEKQCVTFSTLMDSQQSGAFKIVKR